MPNYFEQNLYHMFVLVDQEPATNGPIMLSWYPHSDSSGSSW